jgi:hypothetical protein
VNSREVRVSGTKGAKKKQTAEVERDRDDADAEVKGG